MKRFFQAVLARAAGFKWNPEGKIWGQKSVAAGSLGSAGAIVALGKVFGISAVIHSSGGLILTGSAGYISGTFLGALVGFFAWLVLPVLMVVGLIAMFWRQIGSFLRRVVGKWVKTDDSDGI